MPRPHRQPWFRKVGYILKYKESVKKQNHVVVEISPDEYSYEILSETLRSELQGSWSKQSSFAAAWKYVLLIKTLVEVRNRTPSDKTASYKKVHGFLRDRFKNNQFEMLDSLLSYLKRFEGIKIGTYEASVKTRELTSLYKLEDIYHLVPALQDLLGGVRVSILVDELDRGWDASEDARLFVSGVFQAAMQLNQLSPNFRVLISLRRELYDNIPELFDDAQKFRDLIRYLRWDENSLKELAGSRIRAATRIGEAVSSDAAWDLVFEETLSYRKTKSFNYIVDRTLYRPREIIHFCNEL